MLLQFDANRVNKELGAQTQITQEFGKEAPKAVAEFAEKKMEAYETAQKAVNMLREDLEATKDPEKIVYISDQLQLAEQQLNESETDYQNWKEGGKYRVATHALLLGGLGTGSVEGVLTTGGVAAAAPTITNLEAKMRDNLIAQGMDADTASNTTKGITSLALAGAGVAVGLDTSSTVTAVNVDANNRQLHPEEAALIKQLAQDYAQKNDISITEAEKRLTRGALYNIDVGWQSSIKNYIDAQEIQTYQQAYKYLTNQTRDISVSDLSNQISLSNQPITEVSDPTLPNVTLDEIVVNASKESVSGSEGQREDYYLDTVANGFTATKEDFKNEELFLVNAFSNTETKNLLEDRAAIKQSEVGFIEGISRDAKGAKGTIVGTSTGIYTGAKETIETIVDGANAIGRTVEDLINKPQKTLNNGISKGQDIFENAPQIAQEGFNQLEDAAALSNAKLNLYDLQQDAEAKARYKANIVGQLAGGGGVGSAGKKVVKKGGDIIDDVASDIGKGLDGMTPKPATVVGTPDIDGATTIIGKPDGNNIGAAENGGAILSTGGGDADKLYDNIRADSTDIDLIAKNTGLKPENIEKVKNHVFYDEHLLDKYVDYGIPAEKRRFDSSLEQSQAWERLKTGSYTEDDITWLKHETAERWYENKNSAGYTESHDAAEKKWTGNPWEINK